MNNNTYTFLTLHMWQIIQQGLEIRHSVHYVTLMDNWTKFLHVPITYKFTLFYKMFLSFSQSQLGEGEYQQRLDRIPFWININRYFLMEALKFSLAVHLHILVQYLLSHASPRATQVHIYTLRRHSHSVKQSKIALSYFVILQICVTYTIIE
jgi:hypothetical protein